MRQTFRFLWSIGVACGLLTSTLVLARGQDEAGKKAAPAPNETPVIVTEVITKVELPRAPDADEKKAEMKGAVEKAEPKKAVAAGRIRVEAIRRARVNVMMKAAVAPAAGDLGPLVQQFSQQFHPLMRTELQFVRRVCEVSKDERKMLVELGEKVLKDVATEFAKFQQQMNQGQWNWGSSNPDPRTMMQERLDSALKARFSAGQSSRYHEEVVKRVEDRKMIAVRNLVAKLDQDLVLSAEQREKISQSLTSHWENSWCPRLDYVQYFEQFFPNIPDNLIVPHLDPRQKTVWQGIPRNQNIFLGLGFVGNVMPEDGPFDEDWPEEPPKAEAAQTKK